MQRQILSQLMHRFVLPKTNINLTIADSILLSISHRLLEVVYSKD